MRKIIVLLILTLFLMTSCFEDDFKRIILHTEHAQRDSISHHSGGRIE